MQCSVTYVNEESAVIFSLDFTDENGVSFPIDALTDASFQVCDDSGTVINGRAFAGNSIDSSGIIVLTGADLAIGDNGTVRYLGISITYDSSVGANLSAKFEEKFVLNNLKNIT